MDVSNCYNCKRITYSRFVNKLVNWAKNNNIISTDKIHAEYCLDCGCLKFGSCTPIKKELEV